MHRNLKTYPKIILAKQLLEDVKDSLLTSDDRIKLTKELASYILSSALYIQTPSEIKQQSELASMMNDAIGKVFINSLIDQSFRPKSVERIANQLIYNLHFFGIPKYLPLTKRLSLYLFRWLGEKIPNLLVPLAIFFLRKQTSNVIIPGEKDKLAQHIKKRKQENVRLNLNHLGEAILGEEEANNRLTIYLNDLKDEAIDYVSIKISTIYSQINLISWDTTIEALSEKLRTLYRQAMNHPLTQPDGSKIAKFVNLDMEEYKDLHLTKELFKKVLSEKEFFNYSAGIVLQAYLPDSHEIQKELTLWAQKRVKQGGAPIKIRIVKGANLAMEQCEASIRNWAQTPYTSKIETDANYKRMLHYAFIQEHIKCVHIGVGSHNLFDIAYALILRSENNIEDFVHFEMLEGMADHVRKVIHELSGNILLYCAVATKEDFQSAIAYLIRRLDENTGPENFLRHMFGLKPGTEQWESQALFFNESCLDIEKAPLGARRRQNRYDPLKLEEISDLFENEPDTDFSLPHHGKWAHEIIQEFKDKTYKNIPLVIENKEIQEEIPRGIGTDPSKPNSIIYKYSLATDNQVDKALNHAKDYESSWLAIDITQRCQLIKKAAYLLRERRKEFIGLMIADGGKSIIEADIEYSEAIDFAEYYIKSAQRIYSHKDLTCSSRGTLLITPPWNFPISIPTGGIVSALITGNCVIFKPAPEVALCGYHLAQLFWDAGIPLKALQYINCADEPTGSNLIKDPRINGVILTGGTATAKLFLNLRPDLHLNGETGGKNALIITAMADRDLAIKDLIHSAFGHSGQKCSAASLAILEKEVYDDPHFMRQLKDAVKSLPVGSAWDPKSKITPLIRPPGKDLLKGLTSLEDGESWLLQPKQDPNNPNLWSPGIKLGVKKGNYTQQTEFFGPLLGLIRANNLDHAIEIANSTPYGLTSGIHSLDEREQIKWQHKIVAGNCYINRTITGAVVQRQPFGGCKKSSFGHGSKAGGPNYLLQFMHIKQSALPQEKAPVNDWVNKLSRFLEKIELTAEQLGLWYVSIANYAFWWQHYKRDHDPSKIVGQDNLQRYVSHKKIVIRVYSDNTAIDYLRVFAAALTTQTPLEVSWEKEGKSFPPKANWPFLLPIFNIKEESEENFIKRVENGHIKRVRMISTPSEKLYQASAISGCYLDTAPVLANGRIELLHFLREVSLSIDYHRYGNLGIRENEIRKTIL